MKAIKKFFKFIFWTVIVLVLLAVAAVIALPWWVGPAVTGGANFAVPRIVDSNFQMKEFGLNQYQGTLHVAGVTLANPEGFDKVNCLELDAFDVKLDPVSCLTKKIHIESVVLDGLRVVAAFPAADNFAKLGENAKAKFSGDEKPAEEPEPEAKESEKESEPVKVVIDIVQVRNLKVTYGGAPIVLPDFTISGIGKDDGGVTIDSAVDTVFKAVTDRLGIVVGKVLDTAKAVAETGAQAVGAVTETGAKVAGAVSEAVKAGDIAGAASAVSEGATAAKDALKSGAGAVTGVIGEGAGEAAKAVSGVLGGVLGGAAKEAAPAEAAKEAAAETGAADAAASAPAKATKAVGELLGGAGDAAAGAAGATGEAAGAAVNAVKDVGGAAAGALKGLFK